MARQNQNDEYREMVEFILSERDRVRRNGYGFRGHSKLDDLFCDLPDPRFIGGTIPIGREAFIALERLAEVALFRANLTGRVSMATARSKLATDFSRRFIGDGRPVDQSNVDRLFSVTARALQGELKAITHLLPCHLMDNREPERIVLGPVTFLNRQALRAQLLAILPAWRNAMGIEAIDNRMLAEAIRYYRGYPWTASVTVSNADAKMSAELASRAATAALDCLHMLLGARASTKMRIGGASSKPERTAELTISDSDRLGVSLTTSWPTGEKYEDGWSAELTHPGMKIGLRLSGIAVDTIVTGVRRPLADRFLGALQWYGEAVRDRSPSTRLLKFMTAIEHIVLAGDRNEITSLMAGRVAALAFRASGGERPAIIRTKFTKLYGLRSDLVHGSMSPRDPEIGKNLRTAAALAEHVLNGALAEWGEEGLALPEVRSDRLGEWFDRAVALMDERNS